MNSVIRCATGADFDRMQNMTAYSCLQDLLDYATKDEGLTPEQLERAISSRSHFIFFVW